MLLPELEEIEGFREYFFVSSGHPAVTTVTICDTEAGVDESNIKAMQFVKDGSGVKAVERIDVSEGEVLLAPSVIGHM